MPPSRYNVETPYYWVEADDSRSPYRKILDQVELENEFNGFPLVSAKEIELAKKMGDSSEQRFRDNKKQFNLLRIGK